MPEASRRGFLATAGAALFAPGVARAADPVLIVGDQHGGRQALMQAAGVLDGVPYRIQWQEFNAGAPLFEAMRAGAVEVGGSSEAPLTFALAGRVPVKVAVAERSGGGTYAIVVPDASPVRDLAGLKGKLIGTARTASAYVVTLRLLKRAGLSPADVRFAYLSAPGDAMAALKTGSIDAWTSWDYYTAQCVLERGMRAVADGAGVVSGYTFESVASSALAAKRPLVEDYMRRLVQARRWALDHADAYAEVWSKTVGISVPVAKATAAAYHQTPVPIDDEVLAAEQALIDDYAALGVIPDKPSAAGAFDRSFNSIYG